MTAMLDGLWTTADTEALDEYAQQHYNTPLLRDPALWAVFEEDRAQAPYDGPQNPLPPGLRGNRMPPFCKECRRKLRSRRTPKEDAPEGAVTHYGRGMCDNCYGLVMGHRKRYAK